MDIEDLMRTAITTGVLTRAQEDRLNIVLFQGQFTPSQEFLWRRLSRCIRDGSVRRVQIAPKRGNLS